MRMSGYLDLSTLLDKSLALAILSYALHTAELYLARMWLPLLLDAVFVQQGLSTLDAASTAAATLPAWHEVTPWAEIKGGAQAIIPLVVFLFLFVH